MTNKEVIAVGELLPRAAVGERLSEAIDASSGLAIRRLSAGYDNRPVVDNFCLKIGLGECVGLLGPNGCGKSTILRAIAGAAEIYGGTIRLNKTSLQNRTAEDRRRAGVVYLPQTRKVFPNLTALDTLRVSCGPISAKELAEGLEVLPELGPLLKRRGRQLSGGESQIVSTARLLFSKNKRLVLADEPLAELQGEMTIRISEILNRLIVESSIPWILVEHDRDLLKSISHRQVFVEPSVIS